MRCGTSSSSRRCALAWAGLVLAASLAGCASLIGPRTITLSGAELQQRIAARFPVDQRLLDVLDVHLERPRVTLKPDVNRVEVLFDLRLDERLSRRSFPSTIALDSALAYDAEQSAVRMVDVRLRSLRVDGLPAVLEDAVERLGTPMMERLLEGVAVYRFRPEDLRAASSRGYRPDSIAVTERGVQMTLVPQ